MSDLERKVPDQKRATDSADRKRLFELLLKGGGIYLAPEPCIPRADDALRCVLSAAQKRLLLAEDAPPFAVPPNEVVTLRFKGPLSPAALSQALDEFVRRHEILRTLFLRTGSDIQQQVLTHTPRGIPILDAVGTRGFSNAAASRLTQEIAQAHIDINAPPLIRGRLITIQPHEAVLVLSLKAVACDSWSRRILITELGSFYSTYLLGGESGYKEPAIQYRDFAEWQQARLAAGDMDEQIEYWIDKLRDQARRDGPASFRTIPRKAVLELMLEKDLSNRIRLLCRAEGVTPFIVLLALWQILIARHIRTPDVVVATKISNRDTSELMNLVGPVWNMLPLRMDLSGNPSTREIIQRAKDAFVDLHSHGEVPFEEIVAEAGKRGSLSSGYFPETMFVMDHESIGDIQFNGLNVSEEPLSQVTHAECNLVMVMKESGKSFEGRLEYSPDLYGEEKVSRMAAGYRWLAESAVSNPDRAGWMDGPMP